MSRDRSRRTLRHAAAAAVVVLTAAGLWIGLTTPVPGDGGPLQRLRPQLVTDRPAPDFELPDREGRPHRLSDHRGRPVVLNFWSRDCPPCVRELPSLARLSDVGRERGDFSVITVSVDESWDVVRRLFGDEPELLVLFDPEREVVQGGFDTERFPETFLIDGDGHVRARFDGPRNWASPAVLEALEQL